ncbi:MAG: radical SAM protein [Lentisphaerae bacterium]|nr:radical SAM protein [Lentisphaerota bacterium]
MKFYYSPDTYIRHLGNESLLWHKRNAACVILQDAEVFLRYITFEPAPQEEIIKKIAAVYEISPVEIANDFEDFIQPLIAEGLVACDTEQAADFMEHSSADSVFNIEEKDDSYTPLGSFFEKYHIPCEFHIDLTSACTERCVHCYIPEYKNRFLDFDLIKKALSEYKAMGGLTVHLSGGECMLHPDFDKILRFCKAENINIIILSNMTLCDDERIKLLKEIDPQFINVSLYSMDLAVHDSITQLPGSWQRTMNAILKCQENGVHIRLAAPALKENKDSFPALAEFARKHNMHLVPDTDIFPQCDHNDSNMEHALSPGELEELLAGNPEIFYKQYPSENPLSDAKVCDVGQARICLDSQGNYYPCDGTHGLVLGNVRENTLAEVWHGEKMNALRKLTNQDFPTCVSCENRRFCKVCPAHNFNSTGNILQHSPVKCAWAAVKKKIYGE